MRFSTLLLITVLGFLIIIQVDGKRRGNDEKQVKGKKDSDEDSSRSFSFEKKPDKHKWKKLTSEEEREIQEYRKKKEELKNKKTLGSVIEEKKMKNKARKEKFKKNVLKHFEGEFEESDDDSSEEIVAPLRRTKLAGTDDCNSFEDDCM
ncbi:PREDICTED: uncharacterized protein LOC108569134 [Nicrophorus vespilloides]|uniref:Uncharacterized protein LOC108569134 n=1 Tax=Nicrophorus vespilloides TaxID=110193 RepID=A0ABM1NGV1_NICVS|nr:PREDICTED: uncharacterized protein LOC108569134 [Nicrophorus vespilloides]